MPKGRSGIITEEFKGKENIVKEIFWLCKVDINIRC